MLIWSHPILLLDYSYTWCCCHLWLSAYYVVIFILLFNIWLNSFSLYLFLSIKYSSPLYNILSWLTFYYILRLRIDTRLEQELGLLQDLLRPVLPIEWQHEVLLMNLKYTLSRPKVRILILIIAYQPILLVTFI